MLTTFPLTTSARDKRWWSHSCSLGSPDISTTFFARQLKKGSGLDIHTSGFDCNWLKAIIVKEVIVFSAFVGLSINCYTAWFSSADYIVALSEGVHNCAASHTKPWPLLKGFRVNPSGLLPFFVKPMGSKTEGRPMQVNGPLRMELMCNCLGKRPVLLMQERLWSPSLSTNLYHSSNLCFQRLQYRLILSRTIGFGF